MRSREHASRLTHPGLGLTTSGWLGTSSVLVPGAEEGSAETICHKRNESTKENRSPRATRKDHPQKRSRFPDTSPAPRGRPGCSGQHPRAVPVKRKACQPLPAPFSWVSADIRAFPLHGHNDIKHSSRLKISDLQNPQKQTAPPQTMSRCPHGLILMSELAFLPKNVLMATAPFQGSLDTGGGSPGLQRCLSRARVPCNRHSPSTRRANPKPNTEGSKDQPSVQSGARWGTRLGTYHLSEQGNGAQVTYLRVGHRGISGAPMPSRWAVRGSPPMDGPDTER